jgi:diaminopimelate decarboxylase
VESPQELIRIGEKARIKNKKISVALRMNPEVSPITHPYITTGMSENKFGMDRSFLPTLIRIFKEFPNELYLRGLTMHIGSQLLDLEAVGEAITKLLSINHELKILGFRTESLDIGGGLGIHYNTIDEDKDFNSIKLYAEKVVTALKDYQGEVMIEPGRVLVARSGVLLCQIEYIKETSLKKFVIVNTGMHHLMRPALYQAEHRILPLIENKKSPAVIYDIVGPICESSDFIGKNRPMQKLDQGDYLAICDTGAYGFAMANNYNAHELPKEIILN